MTPLAQGSKRVTDQGEGVPSQCPKQGRRGTFRYNQENARIGQWLARIENLAAGNYALAVADEEGSALTKQLVEIATASASPEQRQLPVERPTSLLN
jgi:hypothetical protein